MSLNSKTLLTKIKTALGFWGMGLWPFSLLRFSPKPYLASLNLTDNCCLKCVMCNQWQATHAYELSTQEWQGILDQLKEQGIREVNFTGGEPLMRRDIIDLVRHARVLDLKVGMTTNAYLLDEKRVKELVEAGVTTFNVSMDAIEDKYDEIRGVKGAYARLIKACEALARMRCEKRADVYLCFLLMKDTLSDYKDVLSVGRELNLPVVINLFDINPYFFQVDGLKDRFWVDASKAGALSGFQRFMVDGKSARSSFTYHSFSEIKYMADYFNDPLQKRLPCYVSSTRLCIGPKGQVFGGCWAMGVYGDLRKERLRDVIRQEKYKKAHRNMFDKKCPGCSCGYSLNLRYAPRYIFQEMIYRLLPWARQNIYRRSL